MDIIRKEMKKANEKNEKRKQEHDTNLEKLQQENGELVTDKQDLKFEIDNQKALIAALKDQAGINEESGEEAGTDEEEPEVQVTARVIMDKEASTHKCAACDKIFNKNPAYGRH